MASSEFSRLHELVVINIVNHIRSFEHVWPWAFWTAQKTIKWSLDFLHKRPVIGKVFSFHDVVMNSERFKICLCRFLPTQYCALNTSAIWTPCLAPLNTLRPRQNGRHLTDAICKCIFLNEDIWISINISLKLCLMVKLTIFQHLFRLWIGDKPLSQPMMVSLLTHVSVTRLQWVKFQQYIT